MGESNTKRYWHYNGNMNSYRFSDLRDYLTQGGIGPHEQDLVYPPDDPRGAAWLSRERFENSGSRWRRLMERAEEERENREEVSEQEDSENEGEDWEGGGSDDDDDGNEGGGRRDYGGLRRARRPEEYLGDPESVRQPPPPRSSPPPSTKPKPRNPPPPRRSECLDCGADLSGDRAMALRCGRCQRNEESLQRVAVMQRETIPVLTGFVREEERELWRLERSFQPERQEDRARLRNYLNLCRSVGVDPTREMSHRCPKCGHWLVCSACSYRTCTCAEFHGDSLQRVCRTHACNAAQEASSCHPQEARQRAEQDPLFESDDEEGVGGDNEDEDEYVEVAPPPPPPGAGRQEEGEDDEYVEVAGPLAPPPGRGQEEEEEEEDECLEEAVPPSPPRPPPAAAAAAPSWMRRESIPPNLQAPSYAHHSHAPYQERGLPSRASAPAHLINPAAAASWSSASVPREGAGASRAFALFGLS
uniref:Uncharacterized protein n=1 Tax=Chromera velia CCMP2878 TaxID=1169474 RepID=A0A0G4GR12_9ALVE|eukprot:Cvel_5069.t1-p1 / transcript=Cvel_5069.t1 / gene=Cvel_5069 / organism=Chromera_velia_CCMP2878 / gene_product=hypothetical protein / transcript_product=hypothetical protein / location=Cvel_scaffold231:33589-35007(+) / protein_length=473 / sequence_SO=supercontig / SO=protein_coding / is_pseudo=false